MAKSALRGRSVVIAVLAAVASLVVVTAVIVAQTPGGGHPRSLTPSQPPSIGARVPFVSLPEANDPDHEVRLGSEGHVTIVSFLATQPDAASTPSRAQAVALVSLQHQYGSRGVRVQIVDRSDTQTSISTLGNTSYDWHLGTIPLLADDDQAAARAFGVDSAPSTFLVSADGKVLQRWPSYVLTATAAQAIERSIAAS